MLHLHKPTREELRFRQELLSDPSTMSYNHAYGGTIVFSPCPLGGMGCALAGRGRRHALLSLSGPRGRHIRGRDSLSL